MYRCFFLTEQAYFYNPGLYQCSWYYSHKIDMYLLSFYNSVLQFMEKHLLTCPSRKYLHIQCPGCGFQRSVLALLRGDFTNSFILYPATLPILAMLVFLLLHIKNRYTNGALILRGIYLFCAAVILIQYVYKIAAHQIIVA